MSADNGIYILHTKDNRKNNGSFMENRIDNPVDAYRVAHAQAIDNVGYIERKEIHNLGSYLDTIWGQSDIYYNIEDAHKKAKELEKKVKWTEYGTSVIDCTKYNFPGY